jgi:hypothetical protein
MIGEILLFCCIDVSKSSGEFARIEEHVPRSTSLKGLPLAKITFGPPY